MASCLIVNDHQAVYVDDQMNVVGQLSTQEIILALAWNHRKRSKINEIRPRS